MSRARLEETWVRSPRVAERRVGGRCVLVALDGDGVDLDGALDLNRVAAFVWERLDGRSPLGAIVDAVVERFEVERETAERDTLELVDALRAREAIVLVSSRP